MPEAPVPPVAGVSAIWACRKCADKDNQERFNVDQFMAHLRDVHHQTVLSVEDGILLGSTYKREKGPREAESEDPGQGRFPF